MRSITSAPRSTATAGTWATDYNAQRLVTREADPLTYAVTHAYDQSGNRTSTTDAKGKTMTFTYDNRDRLIRITDPYAKQTQYPGCPGMVINAVLWYH